MSLDDFGFDVGLHGDLLAVGMPGEDFVFSNGNQGAVHLFRKTGNSWQNEAKLILPGNLSTQAFANLGMDVAVYGDMVVATTDQINGAAHTYFKSGANWVYASTLDPLAGKSPIAFLTDTDIWKSHLVLGQGTNEGAAYVYERLGNSWVADGTLVGSDIGPGENMGRDVAIHEDTIIVGGMLNDVKGIDAGTAYVYRDGASAWVEEAKLFAADVAEGDNFGSAVDIYGDIAVVGSQFDDEMPADDHGSVYVFQRIGSTWSQIQKLTASDHFSGQAFGARVSLYEDFLAVGSRNGVYLFQNNGGTWAEIDRVYHGKLAAGLAMSGNRLSIGVPEIVEVFQVPEPSVLSLVLIGVLAGSCRFRGPGCWRSRFMQDQSR